MNRSSIDPELGLGKKRVFIHPEDDESLDGKSSLGLRSMTGSNVSQKLVHKPYVFQTDKPVSLQHHIEEICKLLVLDTDKSARYCLQVDSTKQYFITDYAQESKLEDLPADSLLLFRVKPKIRAESSFHALQTADVSSAQAKSVAFALRTQLKDADFAESFISLGGIGAILKLIQGSSGNTQSYALAALREGMAYVSGMDEVCNTPDIVEQLFLLVDSDEVVGVCRTALELLFIICSYSDNGFSLMNNAAIKTAKQKDKNPYQPVIKRLGDGDQGIKMNALTLLNVTIQATDDEEDVARLVKYWTDAGVIEMLRNQVQNEAREFQVQLDIFEEATHLKLRPKQEQLENQIKLLRAKLQEYESQQPLIQIMKAELQKAQKAIREASREGAFIGSYAPLQRYVGEDTKLPLDLNFLSVVAEEQKKVTALENKLRDLESQKDRIEEEKKSIEQRLTQDLAALEMDLEQQKSKLHSAQLENVILGEQNTQTTRKLQIALVDAEKKRKEIDELKQSSVDAIVKEKELKEELLQMQEQLGLTMNQISKLNEAVLIFKSEAESLKSSLQQEKGQQSSAEEKLREELLKLAQENGRLQEDMTQLSKESSTLKAESSKLKVDNLKLKEEYNMAMEEKQRLQASASERRNSQASFNSMIADLKEGLPIPPETPSLTDSNKPLAIATLDTTLQQTEATDFIAPPPPPPGFPSFSEGGDIPPPPGLSGDMPPPPPPPGLGPIAPKIQPRKPAIKPSTKMKVLHWNRIILPPKDKREESVWDLVEEIRLDTQDFEERFGANAKGSEAKVVKTAPQNKALSLLDPKRSNAVAIMASKLPPDNELADVINSMNEKLLNGEIIKALLTNVPTDDEIGLIRSNMIDEAASNLDRPEKLLLVLSTIPALEPRLKAWSFKLEFNEMKKDVEGPLKILSTAVKELKSSDSFRRVLGVALALGNYMNGGTPRGQADGFNIEMLDKFAVVKDATGGTLLDYLVRTTKQKFPQDAMKLASQLQSLEAVVRISTDEIQNGLREIQKGLTDSRLQTEMVLTLTDSSLNAFNSILPRFLSYAENINKQLQTEFETALNEFRTLMVFFGLPSIKAETTDPASFFGPIKEFVNNFNNALQQILKAENASKPKELKGPARPTGQKIGQGGDPLAALANAIRLGGAPMKKNPSTKMVNQ